MASSKAEVNSPPPPLLHRVQFLLLILLCYLLWLRLLFVFFPPRAPLTFSPPYYAAGHRPPETCDPEITPFYILPIHPRFNAALVHRCLSPRACCHVCSYVGHHGLGRPLLRFPSSSDAEDTAWYNTHPSSAEMLFHARAERHPCRTTDPAKAALFYVPFYAVLSAAASSRQPNRTLREAHAAELAGHLSSLHAGRNHFLVVGLPSRYYMGAPDGRDSGATRLLLLPEVANMTVLTVERHPRHGHSQVGIPYPSYFHPRTAAEVAEWQAELRRFGRAHLFAFVGLNKTAVRSRILSQCRISERCQFVQCNSEARDCEDPDRVLNAMRDADFCLQPPGRSSYTRRSTFDAVLSGCIPVFFSEHSAYTQYGLYSPAGLKSWSVLLKPENLDGIEQVLAQIPRGVVERMREKVIGLIPRLAYAHPNANRSELGFRDAVDAALVELSRRVRATPTHQ